ncbi:MAG TPA: porin [Candidatus Polarisedimenticolaceae bacterium]|nr:porin [Candidatus Polarisedimenticolaceae bacterium]
MRLAGAALAAVVCVGILTPAHAANVTLEGGQGVTVTSDDGDTSINLGFYTQFRFQVVKRKYLWRRSNPGEAFPPFSVENFGRTEPSFQMRKARVYASGTILKKWFNYKVEVDLAGNDEGLRHVFIPPVFTVGGASDFPGVDITAGPSDQDGRTLKLLDAYVDFTPQPYARVRVGQFKVPYGRQELVSDNKLQMTQRGIVSDFFAPSRDRGVMFHGGTDTQRVQYKLGVFNGTGLAQAQNLDTSLGYAARVTMTTSGPFLDLEDIVDQPPSHGVRVQGGLAWYSSTDTPVRQNPVIPESDIRNTRYEADLGIFFRQRANLFLDYYSRRYSVDQSFDLPTSCYGAFIQGRFSCDQMGWAVQAGIALDSKLNHELSLRYNALDYDRDLNDDRSTEATLNYAYYMFKHTLQLSASVSYFEVGQNAAGSSAFAVKSANPTADFFDPTQFAPALTGDKNWLGVIQLQWTF